MKKKKKQKVGSKMSKTKKESPCKETHATDSTKRRSKQHDRTQKSVAKS